MSAWSAFVDGVMRQLAVAQIRALLGGPGAPPVLTGRQRTRRLWRKRGRR